jgi:hypothetical protein
MLFRLVRDPGTLSGSRFFARREANAVTVR